MSGVMCQVSCVMCHLSGVQFFSLLYKVVELVGGGSVVTGTIQSSLLVSVNCHSLLCHFSY